MDEGKDTIAFMTEEEDMHQCDKQNEKILWYVDPRCSDHMINDKRLFSNYVQLDTPKRIAAAKNGITLEAIYIGKGNLCVVYIMMKHVVQSMMCIMYQN